MLKTIISNNQLFLNQYTTAVEGLALKGAIIKNNTVSGTGLGGLIFWKCAYGLILGNNLQNLTVQYKGMAPLYMEACQGMTVVGGSNKTNVIDLKGHDNKFTGVNINTSNDLGEEISQALKRRLDLMDDQMR